MLWEETAALAIVQREKGKNWGERTRLHLTALYNL